MLGAQGMRQQRVRNNKGFTLIEFAVAMVIIGIALAISVPNFRRSLDRARFDRAATELQSDLRLAISTAKATGRTVRFQFLDDGYKLTDAADSTRVIRERDFDGTVALRATTDPLIFPWGMVQPTDIEISNSHHLKAFQILPTGRVELDTGGQ